MTRTMAESGRFSRAPALAVAAVLLLGACAGGAGAGGGPAAAVGLPGGGLTAAEALGWAYRHQAEADLDGDGGGETVVLACDVTVAAGRVLWEDGHRWALVVRDGDADTLAYAAFLPHGFAEAAVLAPAADGARAVLLRERTPGHARDLVLAYRGPGRVRAGTAARHAVEGWLPGSASVPERLVAPPAPR